MLMVKLALNVLLFFVQYVAVQHTRRLWANRNSAMPLTSQSVWIDSENTESPSQQTTDEKTQGLWTAGATGETEGLAGITGAKLNSSMQIKTMHSHGEGYNVSSNACFTFIAYLLLRFVTLDHKTCLKSLRHICSNSPKYIVWVKIIDFSFMPKIIRTLKEHFIFFYNRVSLHLP